MGLGAKLANGAVTAEKLASGAKGSIMAVLELTDTNPVTFKTLVNSFPTNTFSAKAATQVGYSFSVSWSGNIPNFKVIIVMNDNITVREHVYVDYSRSVFHVIVEHIDVSSSISAYLEPEISKLVPCSMFLVAI